MKLAELNGKKILWDLTAEQNFAIVEFNTLKQLKRQEQELMTRKGFFFYIDVWDCTASLAVMENDGKGGGYSHMVDDFEDEDMLNAAVETQGCINMSGSYNISEEIKKKLKKQLGVLPA